MTNKERDNEKAARHDRRYDGADACLPWRRTIPPIRAAQTGGSIIVTYKDDVATLDPAIGYDWQNWSMIKSLYDGLMDYVPGTTTLRPGLAESYTISEDGLVYTFKLRAGVKFHNGREMTADDVEVFAGPGDQSGHTIAGGGVLRLDRRV